MPKVPMSPEQKAARRIVGKILVEMRQAAGLTQPELALLLGGKHQTTISQWETGRAGIELNQIEAYAEACGTRVSLQVGEPADSPESVYLAGRPVDELRFLVRVSKMYESGPRAQRRLENEVRMLEEEAVFGVAAESDATRAQR